MPHNVRVNALCPSGATRALDIAGEYADYARAHLGSPDLAAPAIVYLLSDLSDAVTGQLVIMMNGKLGLMLRPEMLDRLEERDEWTARRSRMSLMTSTAKTSSQWE